MKWDIEKVRVNIGVSCKNIIGSAYKLSQQATRIVRRCGEWKKKVVGEGGREGGHAKKKEKRQLNLCLPVVGKPIYLYAVCCMLYACLNCILWKRPEAQGFRGPDQMGDGDSRPPF